MSSYDLFNMIVDNDVDAVRSITVEIDRFAVEIPAIIEAPDGKTIAPLDLAVKSSAFKCVEYLLTVPDIVVTADTFTLAILKFNGSIDSVTADQVQIARLLARDSRVDLNTFSVVDGQSTVEWITENGPPIKFVFDEMGKKVLPDHSLILDMLSSPSLDCSSSLCPVDYGLIPFYLYAMRDVTVFDALLANDKIDLDAKTHGANLLHYAVYQNLLSHVDKLLPLMTAEQVNRLSFGGSEEWRACQLLPSDESLAFAFARRFVDCPKVRLDGFLLRMYVYRAISYLKENPLDSDYRSLALGVIDTLLVHPTFDALNSYTGEHNAQIFFESMRWPIWPNDELFFKLITAPRFNARVLRSPIDEFGRLPTSVLTVIFSKEYGHGFSIDVFAQLMQYADLRDEINMPTSVDQHFTPLHCAVRANCHKVLRLLLSVTTDNVERTGGNRMSLTLRQFAVKKRKRTKCIKEIDSIFKAECKKISEKSHGHVFDCC